MQVVKYKLSKDKKGLLGYFYASCEGKANLTYYHIHSDEMTILEKWIRKLLLKSQMKGGKKNA